MLLPARGLVLLKKCELNKPIYKNTWRHKNVSRNFKMLLPARGLVLLKKCELNKPIYKNIWRHKNVSRNFKN